MRREFAQHIEKLAVQNEKIIFLTGDLGFMALEDLRDAIGERFINVGVSEQNMVTMAASLAYEGLFPVCYSIAPFIVFRPAEQTRIDICLHNLNVKLVGNGGGFGYGIMGATHHAIEDIAVLGSFQNMKCFIPFCNEDVEGAVDKMFDYKGPSYLRLGYGVKPAGLGLSEFSAIRKLKSGSQMTIVGNGPVLLNVFAALDMNEDIEADVFAVSVLSLDSLTGELIESLKRTKKLIVVEEHVRKGGLGENMAWHLLESGLNPRFVHLHIQGYMKGLSGSQAYHLDVNGLSKEAINREIHKILDE